MSFRIIWISSEDRFGGWRRIPVSKSAKRDWERALRAIDEGSRLQEREARLGARTARDRRDENPEGVESAK